MSRKQHLVKLSEDERAALQKASRSNRASIREKTRARAGGHRDLVTEHAATSIAPGALTWGEHLYNLVRVAGGGAALAKEPHLV